MLIGVTVSLWTAKNVTSWHLPFLGGDTLRNSRNSQIPLVTSRSLSDLALAQYLVTPLVLQLMLTSSLQQARVNAPQLKTFVPDVLYRSQTLCGVCIMVCAHPITANTPLQVLSPRKIILHTV